MDDDLDRAQRRIALVARTERGSFFRCVTRSTDRRINVNAHPQEARYLILPPLIRSLMSDAPRQSLLFRVKRAHLPMRAGNSGRKELGKSRDYEGREQTRLHKGTGRRDREEAQGNTRHTRRHKGA